MWLDDLNSSRRDAAVTSDTSGNISPSISLLNSHKRLKMLKENL